MIFYELIKHQWIRTFRSPGFYKNILINIFRGLFVLYWIVIAVFVGFMLRSALIESDIAYEPADAILGTFLYLMLLGITFRYFTQQLNTINISFYQNFPIKRRVLVNYVLLKPLLNPTNYIILLVIFPFVLRSVMLGDLAPSEGFATIVIPIFIIWSNIFIASFIKRRFASGIYGTAVILLIVGVFSVGEYLKFFSLFDISVKVFHFFVYKPWGFLPVMAFTLCCYLLNVRLFDKYYYAENFHKKTKLDVGSSANFSSISRLGVVGEYIALELKIIFRNKRTKTTLWIALIFLFYGLMIYPLDYYNSNKGMMFFASMFITGSFMLMFGQWIISFDCNHFDFLMSKKIDTKTYIKANYYMLVLFCVTSFLLTTPYFFFGREIIFLHISAFLYNLGVNIPLNMITASFRNRRFDLSKSSAMNYQGTTYKNFLFVLPQMFLPWIIIAISNIWGGWQIAVASIAALGVLGILLYKPILNISEKLFLKQKYFLCEGFRINKS